MSTSNPNPNPQWGISRSYENVQMKYKFIWNRTNSYKFATNSAKLKLQYELSLKGNANMSDLLR